jgi:hypothetical protein
MKKTLLALAVAGLAFAVSAKLPAPDDAAKAKAAEAAAKAAWQAKVDAFQLCKSQDKVAAKFGNKHDAKHETKPTAAASPAAAKPAASGASAAASGATPTPAVASAPPPCVDPGPFAYNPPEQKPLETSTAHSPSGTAASPPSVKADSGQIQASGKTAAKK